MPMASEGRGLPILLPELPRFILGKGSYFLLILNKAFC